MTHHALRELMRDVGKAFSMTRDVGVSGNREFPSAKRSDHR